MMPKRNRSDYLEDFSKSRRADLARYPVPIGDDQSLFKEDELPHLSSEEHSSQSTLDQQPLCRQYKPGSSNSMTEEITVFNETGDSESETASLLGGIKTPQTPNTQASTSNSLPNEGGNESDRSGSTVESEEETEGVDTDIEEWDSSSGESQAECSVDEDDDEDIFWDAETELLDGDLPDLPLYEGSQISKLEGMVAILVFVLTHSLSLAALGDLLSLISLFVKIPNSLTESVYKFHKYFSDQTSNLIRHYYCSNCCAELLSKDGNCNCENKNVCYFIGGSIQEQLQNLFKKKGIFDDLNYRSRKKCDGNIADIYDGKLYTDLSRRGGFLFGNNTMSLMWYSDGVPVFKSSKFSVWPLYFIINELPYHKRIKIDNIILGGIWFGPIEPIVDLFLKPIYEQFAILYQGVNFFVFNVGEVCMKIMLLNGTCDTPARSLFLNHKRFNGDFGCPKCISKGETITGPDFGNTHIYPCEEICTPRSKNHHSECVNNALETGEPCFGVKGDTLLRKIMPDVVRGTGIDVMHAVYLGVVRKLLSLWFKSKYSNRDFSLWKSVDMVDIYLLNLKPPNFLQRMPRSIKEHLCYWKAHELKQWFFYFSVPILSSIMLQDYFRHYLKLVLGIYLLVQPSISAEMIETSSLLLKGFVSQFSTLYADQFMSINVHQLLHLPDVVRDLGPLHVTSCFPYEDALGKLLRSIYGTTHVGLQIFRAVTHRTVAFDFVSRLRDGSHAKLFCEKLLNSKSRLHVTTTFRNFSIVGVQKRLTDVPLTTSLALTNSDVDIPGNVWVFYRLKIGKQLYYSNDYSRGVKTISYCVGFEESGEMSFGFIQHFVKMCFSVCCKSCTCNGNPYAIVNMCDVDFIFNVPLDLDINLSVRKAKLPFLAKSRETTQVKAVSVEHFKYVCYVLEVSNETFVAQPVNLIDTE